MGYCFSGRNTKDLIHVVLWLAVPERPTEGSLKTRPEGDYRMHVIAKVSLQDLISIAERFAGMTDVEQAAFYTAATAYLKTLPQERRSKVVTLLSLVTGEDLHELLDLQDIDAR